MAKQIIIFETDILIGDIVKPVIASKGDDTCNSIVIGYEVIKVDQGVAEIRYKCSNGYGVYLNYYPFEIEKVTENV